MKGLFLIAAVMVILLIVVGLALQRETITRQSVNYQLQEIPIPLYLKISSFLDRHWNYRWLTRRIVKDREGEAERALALFEWTGSHIHKQPADLDVVDDHVWHIIVRGYGTEDQAADVFATLCNYAGLSGMILECPAPAGTTPRHIWIAAVRFAGAWRLCDPYRGNLLLDNEGRWAALSDILAGRYRVEGREAGTIDYNRFVSSLRGLDFERLYRKNRSSIQDPFSRTLHFLLEKE